MSRIAASLSVRAGICSLTDQDGTTILDSARDKIYSVIGVGSVIWQDIEDSRHGRTPQAIVATVSARFPGVPQSQIEEDVNRLVRDFRNKGLLTPIDFQPCGRVRLPRNWMTACFVGIAGLLTRVLLALHFPVVAAFGGLLMTNLILRTAGFAGLHKVVESWPVGGGDAMSSVQREISDAVDNAITWYPKQAMCLQRSAVTTCLLRTANARASMVIGCSNMPFKAHAWVELNGEVASDERQVREIYKVLQRL